MSSSSKPPVNDALDSWKQIAAYLKRDVRTVQRWEKSEGLPIKRHLHNKRGTITASRSELDRWMESRTQAAPIPAEVAEPESTPPEVSRSAEWKKPVIVLACVALLVAVRAAWYFSSESGSPTAVSKVESSPSRLLVLPFEIIGGDEVDEHAGHGLHEALISKFARLSPDDLAVIGRTTSLHFADSGKRLADIGAELELDFALEGTLRSVDEHFEATLRLVRIEGEVEEWSRLFLMEREGLAVAEERVSREVAGQLGRELFGKAANVAQASSTEPEAQAAWLRGRYLWHKGTVEGFEASLAHYEEALQLDPDFVAGHVGLSDSYVLLGRMGARPAEEVFPKARASAARALELDPNNAEAHAGLAAVSFYYERNFAEAADGFRRAIALAEGVALTHHLYAHFLSCMGLHEEAIRQLRQAQALEPLWPVVMADAGWFYYRARQFDLAEMESRRAFELEPSLFGALACQVSSLSKLGKDEQAWNAMRASLDERGLLAAIPGTSDSDPVQALRNSDVWFHAKLDERAKSNYVSPHARVFAALKLGRSEEALDWLQVGLETRDRVVLLMDVHPNFDSIRTEPRFTEIRAKVGFVSDATRLLGPPGVPIH